MSKEQAMENRTFTLDEARTLLPRVREITNRAADELSALARDIQGIAEGDTRRAMLEQEYVERLNEWTTDIQEVGAVVKGMFLVDFDNGEGYYCWKWPEKNVEHYHGYEEGFTGRMKIN